MKRIITARQEGPNTHVLYSENVPEGADPVACLKVAACDYAAGGFVLNEYINNQEYRAYSPEPVKGGRGKYYIRFGSPFARIYIEDVPAEE